jgi:hypothetical protein
MGGSVSRLVGGVLISGLLVGALPVSARAGTNGDTTSVSAGSAGILADWTAARLVPNAGFEGSASTVDRWVVSAPAGAVSVVTAPVHGGARAVRTVDDSSASGLSVRSETLAVRPGETLTAGVWAQRVAGLSGTLYLEYWRADGSRIDPATKSRDIADVAGWQQVAVTGTAPDDAVTATALLYSKLAALGTTVWDDVTVASEPPPSRQVPNAGFEELRDAPAPSQWTVFGTASLVTSPVHAGRRAVRTVDTDGSAGVAVLSRNVPVVAGEVLTASVQAQVLTGHSGALYLEYRRADGSSQDTYKRHADVAAVAGWQKVAVTMTAPADAVTATIRLYSSYTDIGTTVWDEVRLRSNRDGGYAEPVGTGSVLFVGDERVESFTGVARVVHPGTKTGDPAIPDGGQGAVLAGGSWDPRPRVSGTVLPGPTGGYRMWYTASESTGYAESDDGIAWRRPNPNSPVFSAGSGGVVENPRFNPVDPASPRYFMLYPLYPPTRAYAAASSRDGRTWTAMNSGNPIISGWDVGNVTYDPVLGRFVAMTKQWANSAPYGPRTVSLSTSQDFVTWTRPQLVFSADTRDHDMVVAKYPNEPQALSEIYGMPAVRYGEQYLGLPWMFDIRKTPNRLGDPGADIGRQHIQLASSPDLLTWSRPNRDDIITPGSAGTWDWGYHLTGTTILNIGDQTRLYYGAFKGEHSCNSEQQGCVVQGNAKVGLVTWRKDRFVSFRAGSGGGSVTTRTLAPVGSQLVVNVNPGAGQLRVEVLDADGVPVPGYTVNDAEPVSADTLGQTVRWGSQTALPATGGHIRLRFHLSAGDLYSYAIR